MKRPDKLITNTEWELLGERDPLWAVASWPGKRREDPNPWSDAEFYELGRSDWVDFRRRWERYGLEWTSCVEIGCGAGRITAQLVNDFATVYAIDVSKGMLNYAQARISKAHFFLTNGIDIPLPSDHATAAFSCHALQHLDAPENCVPILREVHRVLANNGSMMIHLPLYNWPSGRPFFRRFFGGTFESYQWLSRKKAAIQRRRGQPIMRGTWYRIDWLFKVLGDIAFRDVEFVFLPVVSNGHLHPFVLARK